jgi:hypothetical protein
MWMATLDDGLSATLYGPATVRARVAGGVEARIEEQTSYPFEETVRLTVKPQRAARFPLYLRLPEWCEHPRVRLNGRSVATSGPRAGFLRIEREWKPGDRLELYFPMQPLVIEGRETAYPRIKYFDKSRKLSQLEGINNPWAAVNYGPLVFALAIPEIDANRAAPGAQYGFALDVASARAIRVERRSMPVRWDWPLDAPLQLNVPARAFDWQPSELQPLPAEPISGGTAERIRLVPYGCTKFRITMFPVSAAAGQRKP